MEHNTQLLRALPPQADEIVIKILKQLPDSYPSSEILELINFLYRRPVAKQRRLYGLDYEELREQLDEIGVKDHEIIFLYCILFIINHRYAVIKYDKDSRYRIKAWEEILEALIPEPQRNAIIGLLVDIVQETKDVQNIVEDYRLLGGNTARGFVIICLPIIIQTLATISLTKTQEEFWYSCIGSLLYAVCYTVFTEIYSSNRFYDSELMKSIMEVIFPIIQEMAEAPSSVGEKAKRLVEDAEGLVDLGTLMEQWGDNFYQEQ